MIDRAVYSHILIIIFITILIHILKTNDLIISNLISSIRQLTLLQTYLL